MSEKEDYIEYWKEKWQNKETFFHRNKINPYLEKYLEKVLDKNGRILFPCCGKEIDMAWLASLEHHVVGIEISEIACEEFFKENNLKYSITNLDEFKLYQSENGRIKIYNGDIFKFDLKYEKPFNSVWDRGSYVALPKRLRDLYPVQMKKLLDKNFRYLLDTVQYDQSLYAGPPYSISHDEVIQNFGSLFNCEIIEQKEINPCHPGMDKVGIMKEIIYFITNKN